MISNLTIDWQCRLYFDYVDPNGDVRGGHVDVTYVDDVGLPTLDRRPVPSPLVQITGTIEGRIAVWGPYRPGCRIIDIHLYDSAGNVSNELLGNT